MQIHGGITARRGASFAEASLSSPLAFGGGAQAFRDRIYRGNCLHAGCTGTERDLIRGVHLSTTSRQTTRLVIEISNSPFHKGFDPCRTRASAAPLSLRRDFARAPRIIAVSSFRLAISSFQSCISFSVLYIIFSFVYNSFVAFNF